MQRSLQELVARNCHQRRQRPRSHPPSLARCPGRLYRTGHRAGFTLGATRTGFPGGDDSRAARPIHTKCRNGVHLTTTLYFCYCGHPHVRTESSSPSLGISDMPNVIQYAHEKACLAQNACMLYLLLSMLSNFRKDILSTLNGTI